MAAPGHLNQPVTRPAGPTLRVQPVAVSQTVSSLNLPSRVPGLLYYRGLQLPCLESQHLTLDFFLLSFLILYFISQLCPEFLYFSLYSCQCF